jgi:WD40 repeat protein/tetratricopeptide (TPR) repeat protein
LHLAIPKITDFGLAKRLDEAGLSVTGQILGTPSYMAPEQARGLKEIGPAVDVYALGAILYECLTGRPPFKAATAYDTIMQVLNEEPVSPRRLNAQVPRDLGTICLKCLAKLPVRRYGTAAELADDLGRWLRDEPIRAREESVLERGLRWCRRHRAVAALSASVVLLLVALTAGALISNADLREALKDSDEARQTAEAALRRADADLWKSYLSEARATRRTGQPGQRFKTLAAIRKALALPVPEGHSLDELRTEAIACLLLPDMEVAREWQGCPRGTDQVVVDSALQRYARRDFEGTIHVYRGTDDTKLFHFKPPGGVGFMNLSPDGRFLYQSSGGKGRLYRLDRAREVVIPLGDTQTATFSPDSQQVAVSCADHSIRLYETESGRELKRYAIGKPLDDLFWNPKRRLLAVRFHTVQGYGLLNLDTGAFQQRDGLTISKWIHWMDWHPDGRILALSEGGQGFRILLYDTTTGQPAQPPLEGHKTDGVRMRFNHGGDRLLSTDWHCNWRLWDTRTGQLLLTQPADPFEPHFSADDALVGVDSSRSRLRVFRFCPGKEFRTLLHRTAGTPGWYGEPLVDPEGRLLAAHTNEGTTLIDLLREEEIAHLRVPGNAPFHFRTSGALLTNGSSGVFRWPVNIDTRTAQRRYGPPQKFHRALYHGHAASSNGRILAIPNAPGNCAFVFHLDENRVVRLAPHHDVRHCSVSPDGRWVATGRFSNSKDSPVKVWDAHTGKHVRDLLATPAGSAVQFSPDGKWLVAWENGEARIWSVGTWQEGPVLGAAAGRVAFSPDGTLVALGDVPGVVRLVLPASGKEIARLSAPVQTRLCPVCFSPDGARLVCRGSDTDALHIFRLDLIRQQLDELGLDWNAPPLPKRPAGPAPVPLDVRFVGIEQLDPEKDRAHALAALYFNPFDPEAHFRLGNYFFDKEDYVPAHAHLGTALAFRPDLEEAYYPRGVAAHWLGRWQESHVDLTRHLERHPRDVEAYHLRGHANDGLHRYAEAAADFSKALEPKPNDAHLLDCRGRSYRLHGRHAEAVADCRASLGIEPNQMRPHFTLVWIHANGPAPFRDLKKALRHAQRAVGLDPKNPTARFCLGLVYYRLARWKEAIKELREGLEIQKGNSSANYDFLLAVCQARLGSMSQAREHYQRAVKWVEMQKDLSPVRIAELRGFQAEAEAVLGAK